jgi:hypothetical protein
VLILSVAKAEYANCIISGGLCFINYRLLLVGVVSEKAWMGFCLCVCIDAVTSRSNRPAPRGNPAPNGSALEPEEDFVPAAPSGINSFISLGVAGAPPRAAVGSEHL